MEGMDRMEGIEGDDSIPDSSPQDAILIDDQDISRKKRIHLFISISCSIITFGVGILQIVILANAFDRWSLWNDPDYDYLPFLMISTFIISLIGVTSSVIYIRMKKWKGMWILSLNLLYYLTLGLFYFGYNNIPMHGEI
jgi:hypothetical protein